MNQTIDLYLFNMIEILTYVSGYLAIGCLWSLWFEWFCIRNKVGGNFTNYERYAQMFWWPVNVSVFVLAWIEEVIKNINNGGPSNY